MEEVGRIITILRVQSRFVKKRKERELIMNTKLEWNDEKQSPWKKKHRKKWMISSLNRKKKHIQIKTPLEPIWFNFWSCIALDPATIWWFFNYYFTFSEGKAKQKKNRGEEPKATLAISFSTLKSKNIKYWRIISWFWRFNPN